MTPRPRELARGARPDSRSRRGLGPRAATRRRLGAGLSRAVLGLLAALAVGLLVTPLAGLALGTPPGELAARLREPAVTTALGLSLGTATAATAACLLLGAPLGWLLSRSAGTPGRLLRALVLVPLVLPPVVGGIALLSAFGRRGVLGPLLEAAGVQLPFTPAGVVLAQTFVALPFLVLSVESSLRAIDDAYREQAVTLGAGAVTVFRHVELPMAAGGLATGAALAWARALGEFGATLTFAGSVPGATRTLPVEAYVLLQTDPAAATATALLLVAASVAVLVGLRGRWLPGVR